MPGAVKRGDIRDLILDATERLLARYGYQKTTLDDIAREAGVGRRTIYLHFSGKDEVALCSIDRVVDRLLAELHAIASSQESPIGKVRRMLVTRVLSRFDSVYNYHEGLADLFAVLRVAYLVRRERYFEAEARVFAEVLEAGNQQNIFAAKDCMQAAHTLLLATNSLLPYNLSARELGKREDVEQRAVHIADLLLDGLRRRETSN